MTIAIVKYGMGNATSVKKALEKLGYNCIITNNKIEIQNSDFIILPGVGAFKKGMENLNELGLVELLSKEILQKKKPFLGICLGMQLLATYGNEPSKVAGLGWIEGEVIKIEPQQNIRIPHLGWNNVGVTANAPELYKEFNELDYYFIHSYHFKAEHSNDVALEVVYNKRMAAAIQKNNIYGMQFHPEKSQEAGMKLMRKVINQYA